MLKLTNTSYAEILNYWPIVKCIITLYLFIILLRYAGRNISSNESTLITVDAVSGCGHSLWKKDKRLINLSEQAKV